jgi:hypothetical protein
MIAGVLLGLAGLVTVACDDEEGLSGEAAEAELTATILLPGEGGELVNPETDPSIQLSPAGDSGTSTLSPGGTMSVQIPFNAPNGNVVGAGIRFGANGPIRTVPIGGTQGQTSGTLQFDFQVTSDICNNLSDICHDIKCYEFAVTSAGKVSQANINSVAMLCGNCDEPSCQSLLDDCEVPEVPVGDVTCSGATGVACPNGKSLQFCVDPASGSCWYDVGGTKISCGTCGAGTDVSACASQAVTSCL